MADPYEAMLSRQTGETPPEPQQPEGQQPPAPAAQPASPLGNNDIPVISHGRKDEKIR